MKVFIGVLFLCQLVFADQMTMKDGDRISGDIVKKDGGTVTVKSKNFGTVTLKWDDIASVKTETPLTVELKDGKTVQANLETQGGQIRVAAQSVAAGDVVTLRNADEQKRYERFLHPGILDLWTVTGSIGIAGAKGNAETSTFITPFNFVRASNTSRTALYFNSIRSTATVNGVNAETAKAVRGGGSYNRNLNKRVFANVFNDYEYDRFQWLDLRAVAGGGLGYTAWNRENTRLGLVAGGAWNHEKFDPGLPLLPFTRNSAEAYWGDDLNYKLNSRTNLVQGFRMFDNLSKTGQYRITFDVAATTQLVKWLTWTVSLSDRKLTNPALGRKGNDFLYTTSLGFSWAR